MSAIVMWIVWAGVTAILLILLGYRGTLTRYEEDQIFLDAAEAHQQREQAIILAKVQRIQPWLWVAVAATCIMSAIVIIYYVWGAFSNFS